ncbi:YhgE/Pip domain-containing protein [Solibacillus isronensis]|uniref:YhgE/Pip domain-containing protein n=1 Tax=Solibacillus isronensis TaxID=412383 RepID=UPI00203D3456|nr:ABC transporter permease [Solibacillus isronensis]MCM3723615.1 ABC transporter permease [Solibacillus isronensis]
MRLFKEKLAWAAPIAVILIIALFSVNLFAQGNPQVKNLPVALIVNDEGQHVEMVLEAVEQMSKGVDGSEPVIAFTNEKEENIESLFADKTYYAALVIPEGYNDTLQNALTNNQAAKLQIYINQGFNMTGANFAKTALNSFVSGVNDQYSANFSAQLGTEKIDATQASILVNPIVAEEKIYNPITASTANGSAPTLLAVPAWVGALIGGFIVFLATSSIFKKELLTRKQTLGLIGGQVLFGIIIALFSGFTVATLAQIAGINMPSYFLVAFFVSFAAFCFYLLVSAITAWIGKPAITLFMVVMLLGMGVLMTPQEMLPSFFVNFIRPWVPIRFASEGLREIFYFGSGFYTGASFNTILGIGIAGLVIFLLSIFKPVKVKKQQN